ncbi:DNA polymerase III subunit gamma/tau [Vibrio sp. JC009]|uniref:DNA polymerase III subunit gamma/tau n=1 Tax=Vibrio sp. JC009 TaxID=2912314 RepID=UPI0023B20165|nr:DNA polymerase III subunit gamma/tau [Vibrio sp. JC009]WED20960.1 DNA polymerase III subunit gamma/tau [Vibrio sp. JC009]
MSYLALARKWRPSQFNQVVGQAHVLTALENALAQNRLHHAYLFSGTRGVGKTSIGRLFAKGLNCETGITATPCGQCDTCREIDEGRFVDLLEIDAASRTKVEDTRELLDNVQYKPARGRFKVYLIDEVHMLSRHSFNALLKTLEEPPEYVKFLLATTDPQKLPVTILSRCLQFHLKPINSDTIHQQLDFILEKENVSAEPRAVGMISHAADGSMRDALSLTDQAIALGNNSITVETVSTMLGSLDTDQAIHLIQAISSKQAQTAMAAVEALAQNGVDWDGLLKEVATQLHCIAMYQALPASLDRERADADKIELLSKQLTPQDVQLCYQIALKGREDLPLAPTERIGLEMVVLRMIAFRPQVQNAASEIVLPSAEAQQSAPVNPPAVPAQAKPEPQPIQPQVPQAQIPSQPQTSQPVQPAPAQQLVDGPSYDDLPAYDGEEPDYPQYEQEQSTPKPAQEVKPEPTQPQSPPRLAGLRHQLRSQRNAAPQGATRQPSGARPAKKSNAAPATSVFDRIPNQSGNRASVPQQSSSAEKPSVPDEPYQWKPTIQEEVSDKKEFTPAQIKQALEHTKTPEMTEKLVKESIESDKWSALIQRLNVAKLVEQLALNSAFRKQGSTIELSLREAHAHLNTDKAQQELLQSINQILGEECHLSVEIGTQGKTPLEIREEIYQGKLQSAHKSLAEDPNVEFIVKRFAAQLDEDSVRPI